MPFAGISRCRVDCLARGCWLISMETRGEEKRGMRCCRDVTPGTGEMMAQACWLHTAC